MAGQSSFFRDGGIPTRRWRDYVDWASPVPAEPVEVRDGHVVIPSRPGSGVSRDEGAVARYRGS